MKPDFIWPRDPKSIAAARAIIGELLKGTPTAGIVALTDALDATCAGETKATAVLALSSQLGRVLATIFGAPNKGSVAAAASAVQLAWQQAAAQSAPPDATKH